jgi:hypothetical protein
LKHKTNTKNELDINKSNVPDIRIAFRAHALGHERGLVARIAHYLGDKVPPHSLPPMPTFEVAESGHRRKSKTLAGLLASIERPNNPESNYSPSELTINRTHSEDQMTKAIVSEEIQEEEEGRRRNLVNSGKKFVIRNMRQTEDWDPSSSISSPSSSSSFSPPVTTPRPLNPALRYLKFEGNPAKQANNSSNSNAQNSGTIISGNTSVPFSPLTSIPSPGSSTSTSWIQTPKDAFLLSGTAAFFALATFTILKELRN